MVGSRLQSVPADMLRTFVQSRETMDDFDLQDVMSPLSTLLCFDYSHMSVGVTFIPKQLGVELTMSRADVTIAEDADINSH
jgi:hypothetical protein